MTDAGSRAAETRARARGLAVTALAVAVSAGLALVLIVGSRSTGWSGAGYTSPSGRSGPTWFRPWGTGTPGTVFKVSATGPARSAGIREGDRVLAVQGVSPDSTRDLRVLAARSRPGDVITYRLRRGTTEFEVPVLLRSPLSGPRVWRRIVLYWSTAITFLLVGSFVFWRRPTDPRAWLFQLLAVNTACTFLMTPMFTSDFSISGIAPNAAVSRVQAAGIGLTILLAIAFLSMLVHFALVFPRERPELKARPERVTWAYVIPVAPLLTMGAAFGSAVLGPGGRVVRLLMGLVGLGALVWLLRPGDEGGVRRHLARHPWHALGAMVSVAFVLMGLASLLRGPALRPLRIAVGTVTFAAPGILLFAAFLVMPILAVAILLRGYRESGLDERQQIRWPLAGVAISAIGSVVVTVITTAFSAMRGQRAEPVLDVMTDFLTVPLTLAIPIGFAVGILKYRLMDLDLVIRKTAVYAGVTALMVVLYMALVGGIGGWIVQRLDIQSTWVTVFGTLAVALVFVPARNRMQGLIDRRFFRTRYAAAESLHRLSEALGAASDAKALGAAAIEELHRTLRPRTSAVLLAQPGRGLAVAAAMGLSEEQVARLAVPLDRRQAATLPLAAWDPRAADLPAALSEAARAARAAIAVPVRRGRELLGLVILGARSSESEYDPADRDYLGAFAGQLAISIAQLEPAASARELSEAREIQRGLLPKSLPPLAGVRLAAHWQPAREVAGDYYDVLSLGPDAGGLCIADVSGKGMPAALLMSNLQATVKTFAAADTGPAALCARLNRIMAGNMASGRFITFFYAVLDAGARRLVYCNAGHNPPLLVRAGGGVERLEAGGLLLGAMPEATYAEAEVALLPGDRLVLYTDGVVEAMSPAGELFDEAGVLAVLERHRDADPEALRVSLLEAVSRFCDGEFQDDATLLVAAFD